LCSPHSPNTLSTALFGVFGVERATRAKIFAGGEGAGVPLVVFLYGGCAERAGEREGKEWEKKGVGLCARKRQLMEFDLAGSLSPLLPQPTYLLLLPPSRRMGK